MNYMYEVVQIDSEDHWGIKLTSGDFSGVIVKYREVSFSEQEDSCTCSFTYDIIDSGPFAPSKLEASTEFTSVLGDTLIVLMDDSLKHKTAKEQLEKIENS